MGIHKTNMEEKRGRHLAKSQSGEIHNSNSTAGGKREQRAAFLRCERIFFELQHQGRIFKINTFRIQCMKSHEERRKTGTTEIQLKNSFYVESCRRFISRTNTSYTTLNDACLLDGRMRFCFKSLPLFILIPHRQKFDKVINRIINMYSKERVTNMPYVVTTTLEHPPYSYDLSLSD